MSAGAGDSDGVKSVVTFTKGTQADLVGAYPSFRVQVFADHSVIYEGFDNVRLVDKHRYKLRPGEYQSLVATVDQALSTTKSAVRDARWTLGSVRKSSGATLYFGFMGKDAPLHIGLMRDIETHLRSRPLRCPAMIDVGNQRRDACEVEVEIENRLLKGE